jgi:hypothetical protein
MAGCDSPAQRQVQADAPKSKFLSVGNQREDTLWDREDRQKFLSALGEASAVSRLLLFPLYRERGEFHLSFDIGCPFPNMVYFCKCTHEIGPRFSIENTNSNKQREGNSNEEIDRRVHYDKGPLWKSSFFPPSNGPSHLPSQVPRNTPAFTIRAAIRRARRPAPQRPTRLPLPIARCQSHAVLKGCGHSARFQSDTRHHP